MLHLSTSEKTNRFITKDAAGTLRSIESVMPTDTSLQHELLHAIHNDTDPQLNKLLHATMASLYGFTNLEEQYTIAGIDTRHPNFHSLGLFALSDNTYRFERGLPGRYQHSVF